MNVSHRSAARDLCSILFQIRGSIWISVLPYCLLNVAIMVTVEILAMNDVKIAFSASGHTLMTLIISYLVVAKVNLSYDRYMKARHAIGYALSAIRELNQLSIVFTIKHQDKNAIQWRKESTEKIIDLMDCTIRVIKDARQAEYLARNEHEDFFTGDDPMVHAEAIKLHIYKGSTLLDLEPLERMKQLDMLNEFIVYYRTLLELASTPMPFPLVQMARTFLFLWTFTIPFVLRGVVNDDWFVAIVFVFFLTYGFVGLELVAMKMMHPFGDGPNDLNVTGMRDATLHGIERDVKLYGDPSYDVGDRRLAFKRQKPHRQPQVDDSTKFISTSHHYVDGGMDTGAHDTYVSMEA